VFTPADKNQARQRHHDRYDVVAREPDYSLRGAFVPPILQAPEKKLLRSVYLKHNMEQLKVIKKNKDLDTDTYRNDRGYIFYTPAEIALDRQILESGGRVFDYSVEL